MTPWTHRIPRIALLAPRMTPRLQTGKLRLSRAPAAQGPAAGRWIWAQSPGLQGPFSALKAQVPLVPTLQQAGDRGGPPSHSAKPTALGWRRAGYFQVTIIMEKLGEVEGSRVLNNNKRDSQEQIIPDILSCLFPPNRISRKKLIRPSWRSTLKLIRV